MLNEVARSMNRRAADVSGRNAATSLELRLLFRLAGCTGRIWRDFVVEADFGQPVAQFAQIPQLNLIVNDYRELCGIVVECHLADADRVGCIEYCQLPARARFDQLYSES